MAVVPYTDRHEMTGPLVERLLADDALDRLLLADNGSTDRATLRWQASVGQDRRVTVLRWPPLGVGHSLYRSWNVCIDDAGDGTAVVLNNDLDVPAGFVAALTGALWACERRVAMTYPRCAPAPSDGASGPVTETYGPWPAGWTPFAFAGRGLPKIDERFVLYCGDVELLWRVQASGRVAARVEGVEVVHRLGGTRKRGRWGQQIAADRALRAALFPDGPRSKALR